MDETRVNFAESIMNKRDSKVWTNYLLNIAYKMLKSIVKKTDRYIPVYSPKLERDREKRIHINDLFVGFKSTSNGTNRNNPLPYYV